MTSTYKQSISTNEYMARDWIKGIPCSALTSVCMLVYCSPHAKITHAKITTAALRVYYIMYVIVYEAVCS